MRRWLWVLIALVIVIGIYIGSAVAGIRGLVRAVQAGDGAAVIARTDLGSLRHSLSTQIVTAYLERLGEKKTVSSRERMLANTIGASIADAVVGKLLTAENVTRLLKDGRIAGDPQAPSINIPSLGSLATGDILNMIGRIRPVQPLEFAVRLSAAANEENYSGLRMRLRGTQWKLAALDLPRAALRDLAARIAAR